MDETIGARLYRLRTEQQLSQRDLSEPGVSYAYISRIEGGARTPSVKALRKLAPKLGVSVSYLEYGEETDPTQKALLHEIRKLRRRAEKAEARAERAEAALVRAATREVKA